MRNKDKPYFNDDCRLEFDIKLDAHLRWTRDRSRVNWDMFVALTRGGTDPLGMFPLFLKRISEVMAPRLAVVFRWLLRLGSFPVCLIVANVTTVRIACILCVHLGACRLFTHPTH